MINNFIQIIINFNNIKNIQNINLNLDFKLFNKTVSIVIAKINLKYVSIIIYLLIILIDLK